MSQLVRPDGCRLFFETHGDRSAEPLVLLEGRGGDILGVYHSEQPEAADAAAHDFVRRHRR